MVVHSEDGMDEISVSAPTQVSELKEGKVSTYTIEPEVFGLSKQPIDELIVADAAESLALIEKIFAGEACAARDAVVMNAGAGIYVSGLVESLDEGIKKAQTSIDSGKAKAAMDAYVQATQEA